MRKICFVSGSRADYGLLHNLMKLVQKSKKAKFQLIVTGMHLETRFGNTFKEIEKDGFKIDKRVKIDLKSDRLIFLLPKRTSSASLFESIKLYS